MSELTPSGLPADRAVRVVTASRRALHEHLPLSAGDFSFAGVLRPIGDGSTDLVMAAEDDPAKLTSLAYALLMRACAVADEAGDDTHANACADALECLDEIAAEPVRPQ